MSLVNFIGNCNLNKFPLNSKSIFQFILSTVGFLIQKQFLGFMDCFVDSGLHGLKMGQRQSNKVGLSIYQPNELG